MFKSRFLFVLFFALTLLSGCKKEEDPMVIVPDPSITINSSPMINNDTIIVNAGNYAFVKWSIESAKNSKLNNKPIADTGSVKVEKDTSFCFYVLGKNLKTISETIEIVFRKSTLQMTCSKTTLLLGEKTIVDVLIENVDNPTINGISVSSGPNEVGPFTEDTWIKLKGIGIDGKTLKDSLLITVDKKTSYLLGKWKTKRIQVKKDDRWYKWILNKSDTTDILSFSRDSIKIINTDNGSITPGIWNFENNKTILRTFFKTTDKILFIEKDSLGFENMAGDIRSFYKKVL